jgi:hypothetical protein
MFRFLVFVCVVGVFGGGVEDSFLPLHGRKLRQTETNECRTSSCKEGAKTKDQR